MLISVLRFNHKFWECWRWHLPKRHLRNVRRALHRLRLGLSLFWWYLFGSIRISQSFGSKFLFLGHFRSLSYSFHRLFCFWWVHSILLHIFWACKRLLHWRRYRRRVVLFLVGILRLSKGWICSWCWWHFRFSPDDRCWKIFITWMALLQISSELRIYYFCW